MALTPKRARFVAEYLVDLNATQAAIRAGYSPRSAKVEGCRLLTNADVAAAIQDGKAAQFARAGISADRVLEELGRIGFVDMRGFWDEAGNLKAIKDLDEAQGAVLAGFEVIKKNAAAGDGVVDTVHKIKVWDKPKALETLARHLGLLKDNATVAGHITIGWQDQEAP